MRGAIAAAAGRAEEAEEEEAPAGAAAAAERAPADDDEVGSDLSASPDFAVSRLSAASPASGALAAAPPSAAAALTLSPRPLENLKPIFSLSEGRRRELFVFQSFELLDDRGNRRS